LRLRGDIGDYEQVSAAVERMRVQFGAHPQVLICAAAMLGPIGPFVESNPKVWQEVVQTNFLGVLNVCRAVLPHMLERRCGKIIILAGGGSTASRPGFSLYTSRTERAGELSVTRRHLHAYDGPDSRGRRAGGVA